MFKQRFILVFVSFFLLSVHSTAQKLIPSEVSIHSFSGRHSISGLTEQDLFNIAPDFSSVENIAVRRDYFGLSKGYFEGGYLLGIGFRLNEKEKKRASNLHVGFGTTYGLRISSGYSFEDRYPIDTMERNGQSLVLDSISDISTFVAFESNSVINFQIGFERDLILYKRWSIRSGLHSQFTVYAKSESRFYAYGGYSYGLRNSYPNTRRPYLDGNYNWVEEEQNLFSTSIILPFSIAHRLSDDMPVFKNTSLVFSGFLGYRFYFHNELPTFKGSFFRLSLGVKYNIN
jgi:hypothetical protein